MILVLDNYDSFTYNLVQYLGELGVDLQVKRNDEISIEQIRALKPERILVSPGPCSPRESGLSNEVIRTFAREDIPILGVCLGAQLIGEAFGVNPELSPHKEVGVFPIDMTKAAEDDPDHPGHVNHSWKLALDGWPVIIIVVVEIIAHRPLRFRVTHPASLSGRKGTWAGVF